MNVKKPRFTFTTLATLLLVDAPFFSIPQSFCSWDLVPARKWSVLRVPLIIVANIQNQLCSIVQVHCLFAFQSSASKNIHQYFVPCRGLHSKSTVFCCSYRSRSIPSYFSQQHLYKMPKIILFFGALALICRLISLFATNSCTFRTLAWFFVVCILCIYKHKVLFWSLLGYKSTFWHWRQ